MTDAERLKVDDLETKRDPDTGERVSDPPGIVQRWIGELDLAAQTEKDWRAEAKGIWSKYKGEKAAAAQTTDDEASFNILWSNTEIMVPALYNSTPTPDVRRRFKDEDSIGKVAATVLERGLAYSIDDYDFDHSVVMSVLDFALVGRGLVRLRYKPELENVTPDPDEDVGDELEDAPGSAPESDDVVDSYDRIKGQSTTCEHVQWDDFRRGPGKTWDKVPWIAFRHDMTYDDLVEYFGEEKAKQIPMAELSDADSDLMGESQVKRLFQSGEVWEIWDKLKGRVLFISKGVQEPLYLDDDPTLKVRGFFPMPRPLMALLDSTSLIPTPLYRQYKSQAQEINRLTKRIEKITYALKVRGAYVTNVAEAARILDAGDNEMIPIEDAAAVAQVGLDKLIWIMPVDMLKSVLDGLYQARDQAKQTIYEIIGLSDIMRGATKATETLGAQQLKSRWGSVRMQRMQQEVQRFVRDIIRLKGEVISEHYEPDILAEMTQVKLPSAQDKEAAMLGAQQMAQAGQEVPPEIVEILEQPSWDDVIAVLRSDSMRSYRVTIETDSTLRETLDRDAQGMKEVVEGVSAVLGAIPVLKQAGAQNGDQVAKEIALALVRRLRMGRAVEDSIDDLEFGPGEDQIMQAVQQLGQQVQQGGEKLQQHEQMLGQIVKALNAQPGQPEPGAQPAQPGGQPAMTAVR